MNPFALIDQSTFEVLPDLPFGVVLWRMIAVVALAAIVAYRPWRRLMAETTPIARETAQAQLLIAVAGAMMVIIIGDSVARAFGLVGLGAFIRFRSGIKDPRDAAVMFVMIGVGMAGGLGLLPIAALTVGFVCAELFVLDLQGKAPSRRVRVGIQVEQPRLALAPLGLAFPASRVLSAPTAESGTVLLEIDAEENMDAATILEFLARQGVDGVRGVTLMEEK